MISLKNNRLKKSNFESLSKSHSDKKKCYTKHKLVDAQSVAKIKKYRPLKNRKKRKTHSLKYISKHQIIYAFGTKEWSSREQIIHWLYSIGIEVKSTSSGEYLVKNKIYTFYHLLMLANKKRIEMNLSTFILDGLTEY